MTHLKVKLRNFRLNNFRFFIKSLQKDFGFFYIRFYPKIEKEEDKKYFQESQLIHIMNDENQKDFIWALRKSEKVNIFRFDFWKSGDNVIISAIVNRAKREITFDRIGGIDPSLLKEKIENIFPGSDTWFYNNWVDKNYILHKTKKYFKKLCNDRRLPVSFTSLHSPHIIFIFYIIFFVLVATLLYFLGIKPSSYKLSPQPPFFEIEYPAHEETDSKKNSEKTLSQNNIGVRSLDPLETNKEIDKLQNNIFGYTFADSISSYVQDKSYSIKLSNNPSFLKFEIQKTDKIYVLGFVDEFTYSKLGEASVERPLEIILLPVNWKRNMRQIAIPLDYISKASSRDIDTGIGNNSYMSILEMSIEGFYSNLNLSIKRTDLSE